MAEPTLELEAPAARAKRRSGPRTRDLLLTSWPPVASVAAALLVCFVAIALIRSSVSIAADAYLQMLWGGIGDLPRFLEGAGITALTRPWGEAATKASLLLLTGLSVAVAFQVGLFNIGAQGQMIVGAVAAAAVGAAPGIPWPLRLPLCILAAFAAGGIWGWIPAWLRVRRGVHEVISTIMLDWVASSLVESWLVVGPLAAVSASGQSIAGTKPIAHSAHLPLLLGDLSRLDLGFPLSLLVALALWVWLYRSVHGFQTRASGLGPEAARTAGIPVNRRIYQAMTLSGGLAGLAGAVFVCGTQFHYPATLGVNYGFDGIAIALIGLCHPLGVAAAALFFGVLRAGGTRMQLLGINKSFPALIEGLALLFVAGKLFWEKLAVRARKRAAPEEAER